MDEKTVKAHKKIQRKKKPALERELALSRIINLFSLAEERKDELSDRYVKIAISISNKYKQEIPSQLRRRFCKNCHSYLIPGRNLRVRLHKGKTVYYCLKCKHFMRFPRNREIAARRSKKASLKSSNTKL